MQDVMDRVGNKLLSKLKEILDEKGDQLKVGGPSISRSFTHPDKTASGEEFEINLSVRRVDRESPMSETRAKVERAEDQPEQALVARDAAG